MHTTGVTSTRIQCPIDPSHTIPKDDVESHLWKCNAKKRKDGLMSQHYFKKNINSGLLQDDLDRDIIFIRKKFTKNKEKESNLSQMLNTIDKEVFSALLSKISHVYSLLFENYSISSEHYKPKLLTSDKFKKISKKHGEQQLCMIDLLYRNNCLSYDCDYVEFGCGSARLSYMIKQAVHVVQPEVSLEDPQQFILVDRAIIHNKSDVHISHLNDDSEQYAQVDRITIDISDLLFDKVPLRHETDRLCVISKHLCGVATDLTLRCITESRQENKPLKAIFIALCCHQCCSYKSYIKRYNISEQDFEYIKLLTSWGIGFRDGIDNKKHDQLPSKIDLTADERCKVGEQCKRIIDMGRIEYLNHNGYNSNLIYYCDKNVSPENVLLMATPMALVPTTE
ncbi:tRNA:m(4)X modification enzyme TRM13 [Acrasis kona]|uniref:tRNA:m(4)X modification enzyme TRM13 n=1 Tax=Acrasis kona TaxID=1008807 RepID=A0AAW2YYS6_9EUKA